jgi:hypothetical protein
MGLAKIAARSLVLGRVRLHVCGMRCLVAIAALAAFIAPAFAECDIETYVSASGASYVFEQATGGGGEVTRSSVSGNKATCSYELVSSSTIYIGCPDGTQTATVPVGEMTSLTVEGVVYIRTCKL